MILDADAVELISGSEYFDPEWYLSRYRDVALLDMPPAVHYLRLGARIGRSPGPMFDGPRYLAENSDVAAAGFNPLLHFLQRGRAEGRIAYRLERPPIVDAMAYLQSLAEAGVDGQPQREFATFDEGLEQDFLTCIERIGHAPHAPLVSVIMPAYNRADSVGRAIESVRAQSHQDWELLVVDDGSSDRTIEVIESFAADPRIHLFRQDHRGVSAARNTGLQNATGEWIFYLDSDNRWLPGFIANMLRYLQAVDRQCGYSAIAVENDDGDVTAFRGEPFDWAACARGNYVDLNAFGHARALFQQWGGFDEGLRRMVDWDLILRYTRHASPAYAPFLGCMYRNGISDRHRISVSQPLAYRSVVQVKNRLDAPAASGIARKLSLPIAIKIAAPYEKRSEWGDFHFAESLKASLERLGHVVNIDFLGDWYERPVAEEQVAIVLRGLTGYRQRPGQIGVLWNISHPDQVGYDEYRGYDLVYVASQSYPALLQAVIGKPVRTLLQCTDTGRFKPGAGAGEGQEVLFVGNSRNQYRPLVRWAVECGVDLKIYGSRWERFVAAELIAGENIDNRELSRHYRHARVVLNDHWDSMRDYGFVSNRIFDVLASGGRLVSDPMPALDRLFGGVVAQVDSPQALAQALVEAESVPVAQRNEVAERVARLHSFDARARVLCDDVLAHLGLPRVHAGSNDLPMDDVARARVGLLLQAGRRGPTSSGFIRLIAPLSTDAARDSIEFCILDGPDDPRLHDCDAVVVQRVAVGDLGTANALVRRLRARGQLLFVDNDDAFALLDSTHPEAEAYRDKDAVLRHLLAAADQAWFSTPALCDAYRARNGEVVANTLDPRLWRDYRKPSRTLAAGPCLQLLYMGTATHDADFALVLPALDRLHAAHPGRFALTVVGALRQAPQRPWLKLLSPPADRGDYPRFVRWLGEQGPFDIGLAPLADNRFNACKSDVKFLDYSALGLLSMLSDVPAYAGAAKQRGLAVLVPGGADEWYRALEDVLLGKVDMAGIANRAEAYLWQERSTACSRLPALLQPLLAQAACRRKAEADKARTRSAVIASEKAAIKATGLFDAGYYLTEYGDVRTQGADPLDHFVRHGAKEGRRPNAFFSTSEYRDANMDAADQANPLVHYIETAGSEYFQTSPAFDGRYYRHEYPDVADSGMLPLEHFLRIGQQQGRAAIAPDTARADAETVRNRTIDCRRVRTTIVLPVYDAHDEVLDCLHSLLRHTALGGEDRLLVLDDCSPDARIRPMLDAFADIEGVDIVHNDANLGYTRNINKGCGLAGTDDVVLLNSDTVVGPHWLRNLKQAAYSQDAVGTVTAVSNNAGAFSVPEPGTNPLPEGVTLDMAARAVAGAVPATTIEVPTGNGFCLYIKRELIDDIGLFDAQAFPRGYGEENDFCMRAVEAGWRNVVAPRTYVFHVRSASFKGEKQALIEAGVARVKELHPGYAGAIKAIGSSPTFGQVREKIGRALASADRHYPRLRPRIGFVLSTRTGGTPQTNRDLMNAVADVYDCYALRCDRQRIEVLVAGDDDYRVVKIYPLSEPVNFATHVSGEYDEVMRSILVEWSIDLLHIRHLAWHSLHLPDVARSVGIPVIHSFHDFYLVCPTVNLIDRDGVHRPGGVADNADNPLWKKDVTALPMTPSGLAAWQKRTQRAVSGCDAFVTTCASARDLLQEALPVLAQRSDDFHVIAHGRDFAGFEQLAADEGIGGGEPLRVLLPGNIGLSKGKDLVKQIRQLDTDGLIEFHVLGGCDPDLAPFVVDHGKYRREEFAARVAQIAPHVAAVLSIWPETYCHTLTESWACGLPVVGVAYGAVAERIRRHGGGWLVEGSGEALYRRLLAIRDSAGERRKQVRHVREWQQGYGLRNTTAAMSEQYLALYQSVMIGSRGLVQAGRKRTALVMKGRFPNVPPTAYVRLVDWKDWFEREYGQPVDHLHWSALLRSELGAYSTVVIQRDAVPRERVDAVIAALKRWKVDYVYEIDDDLFDVPAAVDRDGTYQAYATALPALCANAKQIHVTNPALADKCRTYNPDVVIRPNRIARSRWQPVPPPQPVALPGVSGSRINVLYFGSRTHQHDLEFALDAIAGVRDDGVDIKLFVVGVSDKPAAGSELVEHLVPPSSRYDRFVPWLLRIAGNFSFGIAPLLSTEFSAFKSYLKVIEYRAMGLPVLCSDVAPYSHLKVKLEGGVMYAGNTREAWIDGLHAMVGMATEKGNGPAPSLGDEFLLPAPGGPT